MEAGSSPRKRDFVQELPKRGSSRLSFSSFRRTPDTFSAQSPMHAKKKKKNPPGANV